MVGAHIDSVKKSPGANDNGSGVGILLESARLLKEIDNLQQIGDLIYLLLVNW